MITRPMNDLERASMRREGWTCACCRREATEIAVSTQLRLCFSHAAMTRVNARGGLHVQQATWDALSGRERALLDWRDTPEEWERECGGQYGIELVDLERKLA